MQINSMPVIHTNTSHDVLCCRGAYQYDLICHALLIRTLAAELVKNIAILNSLITGLFPVSSFCKGSKKYSLNLNADFY